MGVAMRVAKGGNFTILLDNLAVDCRGRFPPVIQSAPDDSRHTRGQGGNIGFWLDYGWDNIIIFGNH
jgi:hypothetical protein